MEVLFLSTRTPTVCNHCDGLFVNAWLADLAAWALGLLLTVCVVWIVEARFGRSSSVAMVAELAGGLGGFALSSILLVSPRPYRFRSIVCSGCGRSDASYAHPRDELCIDCSRRRARP